MLSKCLTHSVTIAYLLFIVTCKQSDEVVPLSRTKDTDQAGAGNLPIETTKPDAVNSTFLPQHMTQSDGKNKYLIDEVVGSCPSGVECSKLGGECIDCEFNTSCVYGDDITVTCRRKEGVVCKGVETFDRHMNCRYCYQTEKPKHKCRGLPRCRVASAPRQRYLVNCTVNSNVVCLGNRKFQKNVLCNWTSGYRWTTALVLSVTLGGFGADRFYLGHWQEGIGKLFSFGGLGVWTLIDVVLVAISYVGPADGSLYIW